MTVADLYHHLDGLIARLRPEPGRELHFIDYAHMVGHVLYHGTVSDLDGEPRSTWTYEKGGQLVTRDQPMEAEAFDRLWRDIGRLPAFRAGFTNDLHQAIDPTAAHVVGLVFTEQGEFGRCVCLVPVEETDPGFAEWMHLLGRPGYAD